MKVSKKLAEIIEATFDFNKKAEKLFVTEDGHCFLPEAKNHAVNHAYKSGVKYFEVARDEKLEVIAQKETTSNASTTETVTDEMTVKELRAYAQEHGIELTAEKKADIIKEINEKLAENE